jgi:cell shape-determining protein MreC
MSTSSLQPKGSMWGSGRQQIEEALSKLNQEKLQLAQRVKEVEGENVQLKKEIDGKELQIKSMVDAIFGGEA